MCGRYSLFASPEDLADRFDLSVPDRYEPRYNCAPGQDLPVVAADAPGTLEWMEWGFTPSWADESFDLINARSETVREKRSFADAFERRRCLVPADGFYEWVETDGGKTPYRVAYEDDRPFLMAGVYGTWTPPARQTGLGDFGAGGGGDDDSGRTTFAVLTTEPNEVVADLHHRMAVLVAPADAETYLTGDPDEAEALLGPPPAEEMCAYPVSTRVNDPSNDDPGLVRPADD